MLIGVAVRPSGPAGQGFHAPIPPRLPEIDIRAAFVILPAGAAHAIFLRVLHQGSPIGHVLCYTLTHEVSGPLSVSWFLSSPF